MLEQAKQYAAELARWDQRIIWKTAPPFLCVWVLFHLKSWAEPLFGEAKDFHRLRRFRLRGLLKVNIEGVMIAAGQNLKRLIKNTSDNFCSFFKRTDFSEYN